MMLSGAMVWKVVKMVFVLMVIYLVPVLAMKCISIVLMNAFLILIALMAFGVMEKNGVAPGRNQIGIVKNITAIMSRQYRVTM